MLDHITCLSFSSSSMAKMDFLQLQYDPQTDLTSLKKHLDQGFVEEKQSYCKSLSNEYNQVSHWIKQKESIENPEMINKDEVGQTLILEDVILEDETSGFLACKATGDGDCLKKESLQKKGLDKMPSSQRRFF